ncbi:TetR/AcrR family transcriptional regulator [Corynebacterium belfantii]|uniref:TetR/AcrR family transcriptional regulator n=1 Tax=Corynebacterium belfantii TaxID=2014537 RepID=UPI0018D47C06|nr:TetR/AcrR family transcriptional regulator [Corynebacterium belfantii]MBG9320523.1 TetR/AcrR family transcriptional regulator [Corynebacterium belfantii]
MEATIKGQRERIIDSAYALVLREGISSLSVRKTAREASIGASTLRYYFPSQDDLRVAVVDKHLKSTLKDLRIFDPSLSASDRLVECLQQFLPNPSRGELPSLPWLRIAETETPDTDPELTNDILAIATDHTRKRIGQWLSALKAEGVLAPNQVNSTVSLLCALANGLSLELSSRFSPVDYADAVEIIRNVVNRLVLTEK